MDRFSTSLRGLVKVYRAYNTLLSNPVIVFNVFISLPNLSELDSHQGGSPTKPEFLHVSLVIAKDFELYHYAGTFVAMPFLLAARSSFNLLQLPYQPPFRPRLLANPIQPSLKHDAVMAVSPSTLVCPTRTNPQLRSPRLPTKHQKKFPPSNAPYVCAPPSPSLPRDHMR